MLAIEKLPSLVLSGDAIVLQYHFRYITFQVVAYRRLKTNERFELLALKVIGVVYVRWSLTRVSNILFDLETFGILEN